MKVFLLAFSFLTAFPLLAQENVCAKISELGEDITKARICADMKVDGGVQTLSRIFVTIEYANQGNPFELENTVIMRKRSLSAAPAKMVCSLFGMTYVAGSAETFQLSWMNHGYNFKTKRSEESGFFPFPVIAELKCR